MQPSAGAADAPPPDDGDLDDCWAAMERAALAGAACARPPLSQQAAAAAAAAPGPAAPHPQYRHLATLPPRPPTPTTRAGLEAAAAAFEALSPRLPPPPPAQPLCPGVYKQGAAGRGGPPPPACGAPLVPATWAGPPRADGARGPVIQFWRCGRGPGACGYREAPPPRLTAPRLALVLDAAPGGEPTGPAFFFVEAAPGADEAVAWCGGVAALLRLAGAPGVEGGAPPPEGRVRLRLPLYARVMGALLACRVGGGPLLDRAGAVPVGVLAAWRPRPPPRLGAGGGDENDPPPSAPPDAAALVSAGVPPPLASALLPFQRAGVAYALARAGRALIADEMGVGKTVQALAVAAAYRAEWPLLIICPASLRLAWADAFEAWCGSSAAGGARPAHIVVIEGRADAPAPPGTLAGDAVRVCITSYDMLARLTCGACTRDAGRGAGVGGGGGGGGRGVHPPPPATCPGPALCLAARGWRVVVADESHVMRTGPRPPDARHTEAAAAVVRRAARAVLLTGTPALGRPYDLFVQVDALAPGLLPADRAAFARRYCGARLVPGGGPGGCGLRLDASGLTHAAELAAALQAACMVRRLKADVCGELPPKRRAVVLLPRPRPADWAAAGSGHKRGDADGVWGGCGGAAPPAARALAARAAADASDSDGDDDDGVTGAAACAMSASHRTALAKLPAVAEWMSHALGLRGGGPGGGRPPGALGRPPPKTLVFAHHRDVMDRLASVLVSGGAPYVRVDGSTDAADRAAAVRRFAADPAVRAALLSITAAGTGLDFSAADTVVFAELPDEPALVAQCEARAHRRGVAAAVTVYFLIARGTADEGRWQALDAALRRVAAVQDGAAVGGDGEMAGPAVDRGLTVDTVRAVDGGPGGGPPTAAWAAAARHTQTQARSAAAAAAATASDSDFESGGGVCGTGGPASGPPSVQGSPVRTQQPRGGGGGCGGGAPPPPPPRPLPTDADAGAAARLPPSLWFELSPHTGRLHLHGAEDGTDPLGLSVHLAAVVGRGLGGARAALQAAASAPASPIPPPALAALPPAVLTAWAAALSTTADELAELRGVERARLFAGGRVVAAPLDASLAAADDEPGMRGTTTRHDSARAPLPGRASGVGLEGGGGAVTVAVCRPGRGAAGAPHGPPCLYRQTTTASSTRLCLACGAPALGQGRDGIVDGGGADAGAPTPPLPSRAPLFCGPACDRAHAVRTDGGAARAALFRLERGVCAACGLDTHALVQALRAVPRGSPGWRAARAAVFVSAAPAWAAARGRAAADAAARLISRATPGRAWQADHTRPVAEGGGACGLDNLRTLCTACHADATRAQAGRRAAAARRAKGEGTEAPAQRPPPPGPPRWIDGSDEEGEGGRRPAQPPLRPLSLAQAAAAAAAAAVPPLPPSGARGGGGGGKRARRGGVG